MTDSELWHPGSFTKNFSWGPLGSGLKALYDSIRIGFDHNLADVPREEFRRRLEAVRRPDFIPANFFLFNRIRSGTSWIVADELVFQALNFDHSKRFDNLALFAFNLSLAGQWKGSKPEQATPALWARNYYSDRVAHDFRWNIDLVSANDIERYLRSHPQYQGQTTRKLATNLNYLYKQGAESSLSEKKVTQWWVDCVFLALDRITLDQANRGEIVNNDDFPRELSKIKFQQLSGGKSIAKDLALTHLISLYEVCGRLDRFSEDAVHERQKTLLPDLKEWANDPSPVGVVHRTDPRIFKTIPRVCALLATIVGFQRTDATSFDEFDLDGFVRNNVKEAIDRLGEAGVTSTMTVEELIKITRQE